MRYISRLIRSRDTPLVMSLDARTLPSTPMRQPATRHADTGLHLQRVNRPPTILLTT